MNLLSKIEEFCEVDYRYESTSESEVFIVDPDDIPIVFCCIADAINDWEFNYYIKVEVVPAKDNKVEIWVSNPE